MNAPHSPNSLPDVEELVASIRAARKDASNLVAPSHQNAVAAEDNLSDNLRAANQHCLLVPPRKKSVRQIYNMLLFKLLGDTIRQLNTFHEDVVRVLNKLVRMVQGEDPAVSNWLEIHRRRVTITESLAERLAHYDALHIEERLAALEAALTENPSKQKGEAR